LPDPPHEIRVRHVRASDHDRWLELWRGYLSFYRASIPDDVTELAFQRLCDEELGMVGLVAVDGDDTPIGLAHLVFHPATWSTAGYCYLEDLFVDRGHRGGDVAQALFRAVDEQARSRGIERVYWHTQQFNGAARSLYDIVGRLTSFIVYERLLD
jgi:GNAT superfamily N-acetyltransferase